MVGRITKLISSGESPKRLLILMFNKSAKDEFSRKLQQAIPQGMPVPEVRTYHSLAKAILESLEDKGIVNRCRLESSEKAQGMLALETIRNHLGNQRLNELQKDQDKVIESFLNFMDLAKANLLSPKDAFDAYVDDHEHDFFIECYERFEEQRRQKGIRFFSDLLSDLAAVIQSHSHVAQWLANKKTHIIVDEYQDTNYSQHILIKTIAGETASVMAVGDVDQSIYEWRGGTPELMLFQFEKDFSDCQRFQLSKTFRFGSVLAESANKLIATNTDRFDTRCVSDSSNPDTSIQTLSDKKPGLAVTDRITQLREQGHSLNDMVILVRLYSAGLPVELEMISRGIPVAIDNGFSCFLSKEYKSAVFLLKFANGDSDYNAEDLENLLKFPHIGLPAKMISQIAEKASKSNLSNLPSILLEFGAGLPIPFQRHKVKSRAKALQIIKDMGRSGESASRILKTYQRETDLYGSFEKLALKETEATEAIDRCESIIAFIDGKGSPAKAIAWLEEMDKQRLSLSQSAEKVQIKSIHKAKGLEYKIVFLTGLEDGRFPYEKKTKKDVSMDIESERRLFYVGATRAIEKLFLDLPDCDVFTGKAGPSKEPSIVSRFIGEFL